MDNAEIGGQLRAVRTASGRTVAAVAAEAGLSVPYIANLENGRGNPTMAALSRLASALGMRLAVSLVPADAEDGAGSQPPADAVEVPLSLVRLGRTGRFQQATAAMADSLGVDHREFTSRLVGALASTAGALHGDLAEPDWWRLLDALLLIATSPA